MVHRSQSKGEKLHSMNNSGIKEIQNSRASQLFSTSQQTDLNTPPNSTQQRAVSKIGTSYDDYAIWRRQLTSKELGSSCDEAEDDLFGLSTDLTENHSQYNLSQCSYNDSFPTFMSEMKSLTARNEEMLREKLSFMIYLESCLLGLKHCRVLRS